MTVYRDVLIRKDYSIRADRSSKSCPFTKDERCDRDCNYVCRRAYEDEDKEHKS